MKILKCERCGHGGNPDRPWIQRGDKPPKFCWKCHSPYWMRPKENKNEEGQAQKSTSLPSSPESNP